MNNFPVILLSNTPSYPDNQPNSFRVNLPRPLEFSGNWVVGLHSITYDYSWYNMGTMENQWIQFNLLKGERYIKVNLPNTFFDSVDQLEKILPILINSELEKPNVYMEKY